MTYIFNIFNPSSANVEAVSTCSGCSVS